VTFQVDLELEHTLDAGSPGEIIVCKFGRNPGICMVEEVICAKSLQTDRQTGGRRTQRNRIILAHAMTQKPVAKNLLG